MAASYSICGMLGMVMIVSGPCEEWRIVNKTRFTRAPHMPMNRTEIFFIYDDYARTSNRGARRAFGYSDRFHAGIELVTNEYVLVLDPSNLQIVEAVGQKYNLTLRRKLLNDTFLFVKTDEPAQAEKGNYTWDIESFKAAVGNRVTLIEQQILRMFSQPQVQKASAATGKDDGWIEEPDKQSECCSRYYAMGIEDVWNMNYEGNNVTVAIVDIGVEMTHTDLNKNIDINLSYNYVNDDDNANPPDHTSYPDRVDIGHGSKCAGLVAALKNNHICSAGVAPKSRLASIRFMNEDGLSTDAWLVSALGHKRTDIDIYTSSWALPQVPFSVVQTFYQRTLSEGVEKGRNCKGSIFIFAAGNYVSEGGNCNSDGYINTIYGITVSSVGINGTKPFYDPVCACALASTLGEGNTMTSQFLFTTGQNNSCTKDFHMTSASAALASGVIALTLEANPSLTWRDVQHIIVETASFKELEYSGKWMENGVNKKVSPYFGFGLMNAAAMVKKAETWSLVGPKSVCRTMFSGEDDKHNVSQGFEEISWITWTNGCNDTDFHITTLEHVQVNITLETSNISGIEINLRSAMSANHLSSPLFTHTRTPNFHRTTEKISWVFNTVHFWGENPTGIWILSINCTTESSKSTKLVEAELILHGTNSKPASSEKCNCTDDTTAFEKSPHASGNKTNNTSSLPSNINANENSGLPMIAKVLIPIFLFFVLLIFILLVFVAYRRGRLQFISQPIQSLRNMMPWRNLNGPQVQFKRLPENEENKVNVFA